MNLNLTVLASTTIKRKKPWPKVAWLGKDQGGLYLLDKSRVSQLYLPSGKTQRKIPSVQPFLVDVQALCSSPNGKYLAGALKSGKVFVWEIDSDSLHTTPVLDKVRNVLGSDNKRVGLFISNCGKKIILLSGFDQLFLWDTENNGTTLSPGEPFTGRWVQVQSGDYLLPGVQDKECALDGIFYQDQVGGSCAVISWVFNKQDKIHITTLRLQWPSVATTVLNSQYDDNSLPFTAKWYSFVHPLYSLTPAKRVIKSTKAYVGRFSHDGQILAVAMNQKHAADTRMMFYLTTSSSVALVTDLKGCGVGTAQNVPVSERLWWISDMAWTRNNLLLVVITRCGSLAVLTKLGEPVLISALENSVDMGPALYLPLHPRITFKKPTNGESDTSFSSHSETDVLRQRFSVAIHPNLPVILTTDGYLVTIMQLPGNASYKGTMATLISSVSNLVPEVQLDPSMATLPASSATSRLNIYQSESNLSQLQSTEEVSENTMSSCSSSLAGYGLASGDQGMVFIPVMPSEPDRLLNSHQDKSCTLIEAQTTSLKALAVGVSTGPFWSKDISSVLYCVVCGVVKLFSACLKDEEPSNQSSSLIMLSKYRMLGQLSLESQKMEECFNYFKMALELFQWDSAYRNAFTIALRLIHGIIKEILASKQLADVPKIASSIQFLEFAEDLLGSVYSWKQSSKASTGQVIDQFSPNKSIPRGKHPKIIDHSIEACSHQENPQAGSEAEEESSSTLTETSMPTESHINQEDSQVAKALSASWLILYNYTAHSCKCCRDTDGVSSRLIQLLCDVQRKLQDIGVAIPTEGTAKPDHIMSAVASFIERNQHDNIALPGLSSAMDSPGDSLFGRRRAIHVDKEPNQSTPIKLCKTVSLDRLVNLSTITRSSGKDHESVVTTKENATETLLAILYLNLQEYNLRSALELVFSLMEPTLDNLDTTFSALFASIDVLRVPRGGQDHSTNQLLSVLMQTFPIIRVANKFGIPVVQSLGRFMAAYFSNLPLYVFPAYHPNVLPPFYLGEPATHESTSDESFALSQGAEVVHLDREKVASAVRDQGISAIWCVNNAVELMLLSGLISEASWISNNLGDWKHALLLSVSHSYAIKASKNIPSTLLPNIPTNITPEKIILTRLHPVLHSPPSSLPNLPQNILDINEDATSTPKKDHLIAEEPNDGRLQLEVNDKLVKDVGMILQAAVVAGLDVVPLLCWKMLQDLLLLVSQVEWIVPEEFYLPAPPLFCPQPPHVQTEFLLPRVYRERQLRSDIASSVQKLLILFHSSNCMTACTHWYVSQLVSANEKWYNITKDDQDFMVPQSLLAHSEMATSFAAADLSLVRALKRNSPKSKDKPSPPRPSKTLGSSVSIVLACFQQFCVVMWLLHARDKMSLCARKYRQARNEATTNPEIAEQIEGLCWETLRWTLELQPFGSFLGASAQVSDSLLTLLSEMQPSIATAQITAQHFPDPNLISTISGRAKFKRLMSQFRGITLQEAGSIEEENADEPLSVFYREKCLEYEDELKERERLFGKVQIEVFQRENNDEDFPHGSSKPSVSFITNKDSPCVGSMVFETAQIYLKFLDTFFIITLTKTAAEMTGQATTAIPFLLPYDKLFTFTESKALKELHLKATADKAKKPPIETSLQRSQSYSDVRSSKPSARQSFSRHVSLHSRHTDIRRCSSMSDVTKAGCNSGFTVLGEDLMDILPRLAWLNRWSSESSFLPSSNINKAGTVRHAVMKVDVELPMLVNSLWLLYNVYTPWELNEQVNPDYLKVVPKPVTCNPVSEQCVVPSENGLRRAASDSNIPKVTVQSPTTEEESLARKKETRELKKKRTKKEEQVKIVASMSHSDIESIHSARTEQNIDPPQSATKETHRKTRTARRSLKLDAQDVQPTNKKDGEIHMKIETRRKKKASKGQPSPNKETTVDEVKKASSIPGQDARPDKSKRVPLVHEEVTPVTAIYDMVEPRPGIIDKPAASVDPGTQSSDKSRGRVESGDNQPQFNNGGVELVFLLRSNPSSQANGTNTTTDVPLLKLSTMTSNNANQDPTKPEARAKSKEIASQTDAPSSGSYAAYNGDSERSVVKSNTVTSTAVNFGAQYDESRDVSCQTALSPTHHQQYHRGPSKTIQPEQYNGTPFKTAQPSQYNGGPSNTTQPVQYNGVPSGISHPAHYNGVLPSNHNMQYNGAPSGASHLQNTGVPSNTSHPYHYSDIPSKDNRAHIQEGDLTQQPTRIAWPEQSDKPSVAPFPLLRFSGKPYDNDVTPKQLIPPYRGYPAQSEIPADKEQIFPLLHVPHQPPTQPTKTFRLFEVPPAARDLPLLHIPKVQEDKQRRPDLRKIKFADVKSVGDPCIMLKMDPPKPVRQQLLHVPLNQSRAPVFKNIPIEQKHTPVMLLQLPKDKPQPQLVPAEVLKAFEKTNKKEKDLRYLGNEKENVKPKKSAQRKRKLLPEHQQVVSPQDVGNTTSRQRRRENLSTVHQNRATERTPKQVQVRPAIQKEKRSVNTPAPQTPKPSVQLEEGLSEEGELELSELSENVELSDEEDLYFNAQSQPTVTNAQVDEYCRELETKVKKQFEKELGELRKQQMELEVRERVRKEMEKQREQEEVRKRVAEERALQERLEQEREAREKKLQKEEQPRRPTPRRRSVKWDKGSFVSYDDEARNRTHVALQNSIEVQVENKDFVTTSIDQVTQTTSPTIPETQPLHERPSATPEDKPQAIVPVLPPDVFLSLTFTRDHDLENEAPRRHKIEAKGSSESDEAVSHGKENARQFISVADIDNELWEKIRGGNKTVDQEDNVDEQQQQQQQQGSEDEDEDVEHDTESVPSQETAEPLPDNEADSKTYDSLTVKMMESIEPPNLRRRVIPPTVSTDHAQSISKQRLSSRLEEMNERFEVIDKITQNMEREFQSSNVLLNAIDTIGDIMTPLAKKPDKPPVSARTKKPVGTSRGKRDSAPWRREASKRGLKVEESQTNTEKEEPEQQSNEARVKEGKVSFKDTEKVEDEDQKSIEELSFNGDKTIENGTQEVRDESRDVTPTLQQEEPSRDVDESRDIVKPRDWAERDLHDIQQENRLQDEVSSVTSRRSNQESVQDLPMLSSDKLKEIFSDSLDSSRRVSERSAEKRKKVQDWMSKKRKERHTEWKNQVDELRSIEYKPFTTATQGASSFKKIKLAEKQRETKRRTREDTHIDERVKEASNLINEMLSEPVPDANTLRNLRYAPPTPKHKSKQNNRYGTRTKHIPTKAKNASKKTAPTDAHHRDPNVVLGETPVSPIYLNIQSEKDLDRHSEVGRYGVGARSVTPSGSDFVTTKTYRRHEKEKLRRSQELEIAQPQMDANGLYHTDTSIDIDNLMDQIPDGSTLDEDGLYDIDDLISDDSELKELLTDVLGSKAKIGGKHGRGRGADKKGVAPPLLGTVTIGKYSRKPLRPSVKSSSKNTRNTATGSQPASTRSSIKTQPSRLTNKKPSVGKDKVVEKNRLPSDTMTTARSRATKSNNDTFARGNDKTSKDPERLLDNFDDVSPWNTGDSLKMSDDVAQLLAEAKQAIGDDISESTGSIMSNIDWEAVDKIMNDVM